LGIGAVCAGRVRLGFALDCALKPCVGGVVTGQEPGRIVVICFSKDGTEYKLVADLAPITRRLTGPLLSGFWGGTRIPSRMLQGRRRVRAVGAVMLALGVVTALVLLAPPASAFGPNGGTETSNLTVPGPGNATTATDQLPAAATEATIAVGEPTNIDLGASGFEKLVDVVVETNPKFANVNRTAQRIIACAFISALVNNGIAGDDSYTFTESDPVFETFTLNMCLRIALALSHLHAADVATPASSACYTASHAIAVKITKTRAGYTGQVNGRSRKTTLRHAPVIVTCHRTRRGLQLRIRPRVRGKTLRQAVGPTLGMAYVNPSNQPVRVRTSFTVK
jgi:hypothetical protein